MKSIRQFVVDAFTDTVFSGNSAAICIVDDELDDRLMQDIAMENRFSETAFIRSLNGNWELRWFTPGGEIDLCGHATLASAYVVLNFNAGGQNEASFKTRKSGILKVVKEGDFYAMDFPAYALRQVPVTKEMAEAAGAEPSEAWMGRDLLCVYTSEEIVRNMKPDFQKVKELDGLLLHVTARGKEYDCVSRSFAPKLDIMEDPVCGSGHCHIVPYWANRLHKNKITAWQASRRGGLLKCELRGERVIIAGQAALFSKGEIFVKE